MERLPEKTVTLKPALPFFDIEEKVSRKKNVLFECSVERSKDLVNKGYATIEEIK